MTNRQNNELPDRLSLAPNVMMKRILTLAAVASLVALAVKLVVTPTASEHTILPTLDKTVGNNAFDGRPRIAG